MKKQVLILVTLLLPLVASAYDLVDDKGLFYNLKDDGTLEVVGLDTETTEADILSDVTIGGVEYRVTSIGERAFEGRSELTYLSIPWSVTSIGEYAFINCGSNITVNIADPESWCEMELGNEHSSPLSSAGKVLVHDIETTSITIPEGVTSIGNFTFYQCRCITSLTFPVSVRSIGSSAFEDCTSLTSLTLNEGLESIGGSAFEGCTRLNVFRIPSTVNTISINAFKNCTSITDVYCYAENVPVTDENAFDGTPTENSTLHVPVSSIGTYRNTWPWSDFKEFVTLENNDIIRFADAEVKRICVENWDTNGDGELSKAEAAAVKSLNNKFCSNKNITSFKELEFFTGLSIIGMTDFNRCSNLTYISIPSGVTRIRDEAFTHCDNLKAVYISDLEAWCNIDFIEDWATTVTSNPLHYAHHLFLNGVEVKNLVIPNSITSIKYAAFEGCSGLTSVTIPECVTSIDGVAFANCSGITSISIPMNVKSIGYYAFFGCSGLASLIISQSVTSIGQSAFFGCNKLTSIIINSSNTKYDSRNNCNAIIETATNTLLWGCNNTVIPNSVTRIESFAFSGCSGLTSVTIPSSVTSIGQSAFSSTGWYNNQPNGLLYLSNCLLGYKGDKPSGYLEINEGTRLLADYSLYGCSGLTSIIIPRSITILGNRSLYGCSGLNLIKVDASNSVYDSRDNSNAVIETKSNKLLLGCNKTNIPNSVTCIGDYAFYSCSGLTSLVIPNSVTSIGKYAFENSGITSLIIPNSVTAIGQNAFSLCSNLTYIKSEIKNPFEIIINSYVNNILSTITLIVPNGAKYAYQSTKDWNRITNIVEVGDGSLVGKIVEIDGINYVIDENYTVSVTSKKEKYTGNIVIPRQVTYNGIKYNVTSIGNSAFYDCSGLTSVSIPNSVTSIKNLAFAYCRNLTTISIPNSVTSIGYQVFIFCSALASITVGKDNTVYDSRYDCNAIIETESKTLVLGCKNTIIPNDVTSIGYAAFHGCNGLVSITLPSSLNTIMYEAFSGCSGLTKVTIPNSVSSIGGRAFKGCIGLSSFTIPKSVTSIGDESPFNGCSGLTSIIVEKDNKTYDSRNNCNAIIETSTNRLIAGCKTTIIPNSVTSIGYNSMCGFSSLTSIMIPSSVTSIEFGAFQNCGLVSIIIPNTVNKIGRCAFDYCSKLKYVISEIQDPFAIDNDVFSVFTTATLIVPKDKKTNYQLMDGWNMFTKIIEKLPGDVNLDGETNITDLNNLVDFILGKKPKDFYEGMADMNDDKKVNTADVVAIINFRSSQGLSTGYQMYYEELDGKSVVSSLTCTLNNKRNEVIELVKCELYCNNKIVSNVKLEGSLTSGGSKTCSFDNLTKYAGVKGFSVLWHYTFKGESFIYRCNLTE